MAPAPGSRRLHQGNSVARSRTVSVELTASQGITAYQLSESADFSGAKWRPFAPRVEWTFNEDGTQRLFVRFADPNGLAYSGPRMAEVFVDSSLPEGTLQFQGGGQATATYGITRVEAAP
ncbi:hypothetical protein ACLESO_33860 [Pyxidicoccus sp. 3LG]